MSSRAPAEDLASSIGAYYLSQQLSSIMGGAIEPLIVRTGFMHDIGGRLDKPIEIEVIVWRRIQLTRNVLRDAKYGNTLPEDIQNVVRSSLRCGFQFVPVLSAIAVVFNVPILVFMREGPVEWPRSCWRWRFARRCCQTFVVDVKD
ncbi:uncharacterized protein BP01DRAFT_367385 [Aspergillus saccharolyticus JOP 1030-1]|uniref:Uncharacterized protein n=1 Tax=Aspergillus saccharolyticus JOP 1030-1 TaxID=1450539 RepID=A0A318ZA74_9EURO|nr:hypothetical protein BP01DRAFT_367385 [Aspergillus saccharolyticus JOP 1030-1]PYH43347.1 hypothetical protein BP01DRAFT_367385 [Aspergillus saccharolyticus JOP 1030-1]